MCNHCENRVGAREYEYRAISGSEPGTWNSVTSQRFLDLLYQYTTASAQQLGASTTQNKTPTHTHQRGGGDVQASERVVEERSYSQWESESAGRQGVKQTPLIREKCEHGRFAAPFATECKNAVDSSNACNFVEAKLNAKEQREKKLHTHRHTNIQTKPMGAGVVVSAALKS